MQNKKGKYGSLDMVIPPKAIVEYQDDSTTSRNVIVWSI